MWCTDKHASKIPIYRNVSFKPKKLAGQDQRQRRETGERQDTRDEGKESGYQGREETRQVGLGDVLDSHQEVTGVTEEPGKRW